VGTAGAGQGPDIVLIPFAAIAYRPALRGRAALCQQCG